VARIGTAAAPQPAWPDPTWPKVGDAEIASVFCAPAAPGLVGLAVNADVGLPGPAAFILPVRAEWQLDPTPLPTTTTTTLPPSGCTSAADCPDTDGCTVDACDAGRCTNTPLSGAAAATCRFLAFSAADLCPGLDTKLGGAVAKLVDRARAAVDAVAGAKAKKATKLRRRASAALAMVLRKVGKAEKKGAIEGGCAGALRDGVGRLQQSVAAIGG
jgi:hypothetical protein